MVVNEVQYLQFSGIDFTNFINFVKSMNSRDKSKSSKLAILEVSDNVLICKYIDDTSNYIEYYVELYKSENMINEAVAISVNDIAMLIKCACNNEKFTIRKYYNQFEFNVIGNGWLPFKTTDIDISKFTLSGDEYEIGRVNSANIRNAISSVLSYTQEYTYARDKYIQFTNKQMTATSRMSSVVMSGDFVNMTLHRDNAAMLRQLLKDNFELVVSELKSSVERLSFKGEKFRFVVIATDVDSANVQYVENIENYITVDCDELYRMVTFAEEYSASKKTIGLTVKDGELQISVKNVLAAKHMSKIRSTIVGNLSDIQIGAEIPAHSILKALKLFQDKKDRDVNIYLSDNDKNCIVMFDNNTQAIINIYNR